MTKDIQDLLDELEDASYNREDSYKINRTRRKIDEYLEKTNIKKPRIPKYVADWIEYHRVPIKNVYERGKPSPERIALGDSIDSAIYHLFADLPETCPSAVIRKQVLKWVCDDRYNYFLLVDAVRYGYDFVDEKHYKFDLKEGVYISFKDKTTNIKLNNYIDKTLSQSEVDEIKSIDERLMVFIKEVE